MQIRSTRRSPGPTASSSPDFPQSGHLGSASFTGERVTSASPRHTLGEESCRALLLLESSDDATAAALRRALEWINARVGAAVAYTPRNNEGVFCCGNCTVGLWRNILAGGLDRPDQRLGAGLIKLREQRKGNGEWRTFRFWYTVLALADTSQTSPRRATASGSLAAIELDEESVGGGD